MPPPSRPKQTIANKKFKEPYRGDEAVINNPVVKSIQPSYPIDFADYLILTSKEHASFLVDHAVEFSAATTILFFTLLIRYIIDKIQTKPSDVGLWEIGLLIILLIISVITRLIVRKTSTKKKALLENMKNHFENNPKTFIAAERREDETK